MPESMVPVGDAELCVDTVGSAGDPAVLLIGGATSSMDWWEPEFCERIAAAGRFVIRYDNRDTGQSTAARSGSRRTPGPTCRPTRCASSTPSASRARTWSASRWAAGSRRTSPSSTPTGCSA